MAEVVRCEPGNMDELKDIVNEFAENMDPDLVRRMCAHTRKRAEICVAQKGCHFEHLLK